MLKVHGFRMGRTKKQTILAPFVRTHLRKGKWIFLKGVLFKTYFKYNRYYNIWGLGDASNFGILKRVPQMRRVSTFTSFFPLYTPFTIFFSLLLLFAHFTFFVQLTFYHYLFYNYLFCNYFTTFATFCHFYHCL